MQGINNIIFDLGGVIINLDIKRTLDAFADLSPNMGNVIYTQNYQHELFHRFEEAAITADKFRDELRTSVGENFTDAEIDHAWNAMLLDIPAIRLERILDLKEKYKVFLFSNTNTIHFEAFLDILKRDTGATSLDPYFHHCYYSHTLGMRKPKPEAFQHILNEQGLIANETLFMDDTPGHLEGAGKVGIKTVQVTRENHMLEILKDF